MDLADGEEGEVAEGDGSASDEAKEKFVETVEDFEESRLEALFALGNDAEVWAAVCGLNKASKRSRWVFAIGVHDKNGLGVGVIGCKAEANGDGSLMTDVDSEVHDLDASEVGQGRQIGEDRVGVFRRAVVYGTDEETKGKRNGGLIQLSQEATKRGPVIEDGSDDSHTIHYDS
jgi:hypothetical protein